MTFLRCVAVAEVRLVLERRERSNLGSIAAPSWPFSFPSLERLVSIHCSAAAAQYTTQNVNRTNYLFGSKSCLVESSCCASNPSCISKTLLLVISPVEINKRYLFDKTSRLSRVRKGVISSLIFRKGSRLPLDQNFSLFGGANNQKGLPPKAGHHSKSQFAL